MDNYLIKPVKDDVLRPTLERWTKSVKPGEALSPDNGTAQDPSGGLTDTLAVEPQPSCSAGDPAMPRPGPSIDQTQLASLRTIQQPGKADIVTELIDLFLNESTSHLKALHEALERGDAVEVQRVAHRLRGSSGNMGATQMAALSQVLERKNSAKDALELVTQLENEFELVSEALKVERNEVDPALCAR